MAPAAPSAEPQGLSPRSAAMLFEQSMYGVLLTAPDGRILDANTTAQQMLRHSKQELRRIGRAGLADPGDPRWEPAVAERRRTGRVAAFLRMLRGDGTTFEAEVDSAIFRDDGGEERACVIFRDVTDRTRLEETLRAAEERFRAAFENAPIGMAIVGLDGQFLEVNEAFCELVSYRPEELRERTFQDITHPDDLQIDLAHAQQLLSGEINSYRMEKRYYDARGRIVWVQLSGSVVRDAEGQPIHFIAQVEDIGDRKRREAELTRLAERDPITGLMNRAVFERDLVTFQRAARRYGDRTALLVVDLDQFKSVNDSAGHAAGDLLLREVANAIRQRVRITDHCYRIGGDEFAVILPHGTAEAAFALADGLRSAIAAVSVTAGAETFGVTASIGVAPIVGDPAETPLATADTAMYADKRRRGPVAQPR